MTTILVTGFGPFPGMPFNPTATLVERIARTRRVHAALATHIFPTTFAAVDRDLPRLLARHRPDAVLMFGVAGRARGMRIERRARNARGIFPDARTLPDARGIFPDAGPGRGARAVVSDARTGRGGGAIETGAASVILLPAPVHRLLAAARAARCPASLSQDAGRYVCNHLARRAAEAVAAGHGPRLAAFVHVPPVPRVPRPRRANRRHLSLDDLVRAGERLLIEMIAAARR